MQRKTAMAIAGVLFVLAFLFVLLKIFPIIITYDDAAAERMAKLIHTGMSIREVLAVSREWDRFNAGAHNDPAGSGWAQIAYLHSEKFKLECPAQESSKKFETEEEFLRGLEQCIAETGSDWGVAFHFSPKSFLARNLARWNIYLELTIGPDGKVKDSPKVSGSGP